MSIVVVWLLLFTLEHTAGSLKYLESRWLFCDFRLGGSAISKTISVRILLKGKKRRSLQVATEVAASTWGRTSRLTRPSIQSGRRSFTVAWLAHTTLNRSSAEWRPLGGDGDVIPVLDDHEGIACKVSCRGGCHLNHLNHDKNHDYLWNMDWNNQFYFHDCGWLFHNIP